MKFLLKLFNIIWNLVLSLWRSVFPKNEVEEIQDLKAFNSEPASLDEHLSMVIYSEEPIIELPRGINVDKPVEIVDEGPQVFEDAIILDDLLVEPDPKLHNLKAAIEVLEQPVLGDEPIMSFMGGMGSNIGLGASFILNNRIHSVRMGSKFY